MATGHQILCSTTKFASWPVGQLFAKQDDLRAFATSTPAGMSGPAMVRRRHFPGGHCTLLGSLPISGSVDRDVQRDTCFLPGVARWVRGEVARKRIQDSLCLVVTVK